MPILQLLLGLLGLLAMSGGSSSSAEASPTTLRNGRAPEKVNKKALEAQSKNDVVVATDDTDANTAQDTTTTDDPTVVVDDPSNVVAVDDPAPVEDTPTDPVVTVDDPIITVNDPTPTAPEQLIDSSDGGGIAPTTLTNGLDVAGGRVTTLQLDNADTIDSVRVTDLPAHGNLTVNPDNTLALVMSGDDYNGSLTFGYEVTYQDGSTQAFENTVDVLPQTQGAGWAEGNYYMLETDENDDVIVEYGDNHRDVFISGSEDALSLNDIAALEGLNVSQITTSWLQDHPEYGGSEDMALDSHAGMQLWYGITGTGSEPSSNWLLFEAGYEYNNLGSVIESGTAGEDPLHPVHITSYGDGPKPILNTAVYLSPWESAWDAPTSNIVLSDISVTGGVTALSGSNFILDNVDITNDSLEFGKMGLHIGYASGVTLHNSSVTDVYYTEHPDGAAYWAGNEMASGVLIGQTDGILIEGSYFAQNGWAPDYYENMSTDGGQPPGMFSHNVYLDWNNTDITFRDNITMQAASFGAHIRPGGFIEDNVFLDNNAAVDITGGEFEGSGFVGNFSLFTNNLITSAGYLDTNSATTGFLSQGFINLGQDTTMLDNIIAHLADPNNLAEIAEKQTGHYPISGDPNDLFYNDTIVYNWEASGQEQWGYDSNYDDRNIEGLDTSVLNATTIQIFTQQLLGDPNATIDDLADFLRAQASGALDDYVDADLIIDFFQTGFGLSIGDRLSPEVARFVPNDLGDGIRWDNRLNWSTDDLPGSVAGDSVDLGGNWVNYGGTTTIQDLDFGSGGELSVSHGYLQVNGTLSAGENGATLNISNAGQFWTNGYSDTNLLDINITGGRFANTGHFDGAVDMHISDYGQAILATDGATFDLRTGSHLNIDGDDAKVGFDGETGDTAVLRLDEGATLGFSTEDGQLGMIEEFRSGHFGDAPNVLSGVNLGSSTLSLDLTGLTELNATLIEVDEIIGSFGDIQITGLGSNSSATLTVDYDTDQVTLSVGAGDGSVTVNTVGDEDAFATADSAGADLWAALTDGHGVYTDDTPVDPIEEDEFLIAAE